MLNKKLSTQSLANLSSLGKIVRDKGDAGKTFQTLQVNRIYSKAQPRTVFERIEELAENMKAIGQQQPIVVSPDGTGRYVIEQGERRWRAAKLAQLLTLDCIVKKAESDDLKRLIRQLSENIQREEMTLWDLSNCISLLVTKGMTIREIASQLGKKDSYISVLNAIHDLPEELEALVKNQHIADPVAVRKLQKLFSEEPDAVRIQLQRWADLHKANETDTPFIITRAQVNAFIKFRNPDEVQQPVEPNTDVKHQEESNTFLDTSSGTEEDMDSPESADYASDSETEVVGLEDRQPEKIEVDLPAGCSSISPLKVRTDVLWHENEAFITPGVLSPTGKVCITIKATKEIYLADVSSIVFVGVSKF